MKKYEIKRSYTKKWKYILCTKLFYSEKYKDENMLRMFIMWYDIELYPLKSASIKIAIFYANLNILFRIIHENN